MKRKTIIKLTSALLALALSMSLSVTVFAAEKGVYTDVPEDHFAYEAIMRYTDEGVICGTSADTFSPDEPISYAEFITVLMRVLHPEKTYSASANMPWYMPYLTEAYRCGLLDISDVLQDGGTMHTLPQTLVSRQNGLSAIMKAYFDEGTIKTAGKACDFNTVRYAYEDRAYIKAAIGLDIYHPNENDPVPTAMTRAEMVQWLYLASNLGTPQYQSESKTPFITWEDRYNSSYGTGCIPERLMAQIDKIPSNVIIDFIRNGWSIKVVEEAEEYYNGEAASIVALCSYSRKTIFVEAKTLTPTYPKSSLSHEIGHYLEVRLKSNPTASILFELEAKPLAEATKTSYCLTNEQEFFAEVTQMYLFYSPEKLAAARQSAPNAFAYVEAALRAPIINGRLSTTEEITTLEQYIQTLSIAR